MSDKMMEPRLIELFDGVPVRSYALPYDRRFTVGRFSRSDVVVRSRFVAREQFVISYGWGGFSLCSRGRLLTLVNGTAMMQDVVRPLDDGDRIEFEKKAFESDHSASEYNEKCVSFKVALAVDPLPLILRSRFPAMSARLNAGDFDAAAGLFADSYGKGDRIGCLLFGFCRALAGDMDSLRSAVAKVGDANLECDSVAAMLLSKCRAMCLKADEAPLEIATPADVPPDGEFFCLYAAGTSPQLLRQLRDDYQRRQAESRARFCWYVLFPLVMIIVVILAWCVGRHW